ncbi:septal ring lytic transglycosylase RlpA family protein [Flavobacterium nackdongense]|uniref:Probable endolytic peptidoglycan transglycosylase RlpA n=1 Tax=Flavobacterium nackdongense TaxID=2547394 RepID=A0A4P6YF03_9FLAO|nr:septal ring lytic transglycosylase RlpA family protein [Flavobacterium nackdongense]QBN19454.1 septal ring lytic transglycosylase RlpA family protein [Flavobacterium nackdongense]
MNSKRQKYQKNPFFSLVSCSFFVFISLAFFVVAHGQSLNKVKSKTTKTKDSVAKTKVVAAKSEKTITAVDTVKKINPIFDQPEVGIDSLFLGTGKFKLYKKNAHASYYHDKFHSKKTASGKKYDKNKYSAAHKKLPFGTIVKVTNEANGKSVLVEVTDRGPFVRSREIDLSRKAFMEIASNKSSGNMKVTLEVRQK